MLVEPATRFRTNPIKIVLGIAVTIGIVIIFTLSYFTVEQYEQGVVTRFGKIVEVAGPGLHFKIPFVHSVTIYRTDVLSVQPDSPVNTYTVDNQEVDIVFNVFYRIPADKAAYIYEHVQDYRMRLYQLAVDRLKSEMGKVNTQHVAEQRGKIREGIRDVLANDAKRIGLEVVDF
jgi:regulator of protease activity HflC (stomatin/prohibitin superfamily)